MRKFLLKLFLFFSIVFAIDLVIGTILDYVYLNTQKGDYGRNNYICTQVDKDCLIFGSSRAIHHYSPQLITERTGLSCYNCGDDGMGIVSMYGRYQLIRKRYIPKVVIYDVVAGFDILEDDKTRYIGNLRYYSEAAQINELISSVDETEKYKNLMRSYKYNSRFLDIVSQYTSSSPGTASEYEYAPLYGAMQYDVENQMVGKINVDKFKLALFKDLIETCQKDGTIIVLTISPWYKATDDSEYQSLIKLCRSYSVPVLNHFKDEDFINSRNLFKDSSHLNEDGAMLLCNKICDELNTILR